MPDVQDGKSTLSAIARSGRSRPRATPRKVEFFARATPERATIVEEYSFTHVMSANPERYPHSAPTGRIELSVPLDGDEYFNETAKDDIERVAAQVVPEEPPSALIGHLLLDRHTHTDLGKRLDLGRQVGSVPISVPFVRTQLQDLVSDQHTCEISYDYAPNPEHVHVNPIELSVDLLDPDTVSSEFIDLNENTHALLENLTQHVSFRSHLLLHVGVNVVLPTDHQVTAHLRPVITRFSLGWPTITSLRALHLQVEGKERSIQYNPLTRRIEWYNVLLAKGIASEESGLTAYRGPSMLLLIEQPGELYHQNFLEGEVEAEIKHYLLSGVRAKLANALGDIGKAPQQTTRVTTALRLSTQDAFARRMLSPYQHLHFDEIIPNEARFADIRTALVERGFAVHLVEHPSSEDVERRFFRATRSQGPDTMTLWVLAEGRRFSTEREHRVEGDGYRYRTAMESGEMKVFIRGQLRRDSSELIHEMNELQRKLRTQFDRVRARR